VNVSWVLLLSSHSYILHVTPWLCQESCRTSYGCLEHVACHGVYRNAVLAGVRVFLSRQPNVSHCRYRLSTQGQKRYYMHVVHLLSPGCDALCRRAGGLQLWGVSCPRLPHGPRPIRWCRIEAIWLPPSPLGCLHSRRRQNLCQPAGFSLRTCLSRGYKNREAPHSAASPCDER